MTGTQTSRARLLDAGEVDLPPAAHSGALGLTAGGGVLFAQFG